MKEILISIKVLLLILAAGPFELNAAPDNNTIDINSDVLQDTRRIIVSLPTNYQTESFYQFPVLYMTDGDSQFEHISSMTHYLSGTISPMIVVAIEQKNRFAELAPFISEQAISGNSEKFRQFIVDEVKPLIDKQYRTADFAVLMGHSLGGAFVLNAYHQEPSQFDAYVSLAPSLAWGNERLLTLLPKSFAQQQQPFVAISFEGQSAFPTPQQSYNELSQMIAKHPHLQLSHQVELLPDEDHMSVAHLGAYHALKRLYRGWFLSLPQALSSDDAFERHYQQLSNRLGYSVLPTEYELWSLTSALINQGNQKVAAKIANHAEQMYPDSHFSYSLLADVAKAANNNEQAATYLDKAVELSAHLPERQARYQSRLEQLR
ncbi:hypothetical protein GCM10011369_28950 [Neiella marina]|uniref:Alpha/beta hydrolase n=2 Tax=Neiella marina TaxID=508461 RepID=A0A8J2U7Z8_9GAMM|nr:hypothetical protein GCM10011369_28950 [Neiella marina]